MVSLPAPVVIVLAADDPVTDTAVVSAEHRQHCRRQRIRDLVLDDLRRLARVARADDHLHVGEIRYRVERHALAKDREEIERGLSAEDGTKPIEDERRRLGFVDRAPHSFRVRG